MISYRDFTLSIIISGHLEIVKLLVEHGAEVDVTDNFDDTPLHLAAKNVICCNFIYLKKKFIKTIFHLKIS